MFRELVDIERDTSPDGATGPDYASTRYRNVPCSIAIVSGDESFRGRQLEAHLSHVVELHWMPDIQADDRVKVKGGIFDGRKLNVVHVHDLSGDGVPHRLQLYCRELAEAR